MRAVTGRSAGIKTAKRNPPLKNLIRIAPLFPITVVPFDHIRDWKLFDADRGIDSAREIREYFIPDFSNWRDHDSYQKAFERLLRDLKQDDKAIDKQYGGP